MNLSAPEWLIRREGRLRPGPEGTWWVVLLDGQPQYQLRPIPVAGKYGCQVMQTVNGRRLEGTGTYATAEDALRGGLEDLRLALGW